MSKRDLYKETTSLRTVLIATFVGAFGIFMITSASLWLGSYPNWQTPIRELGGLLFASVAVALLWELFAKRAFLAELMNAAQIAEDIRTAKLLSITTNFVRGIKWEDLFRRAKSVVLLFSYGTPWRNYEDVLQEFALRPKTKIQLMVPDPNDEAILFELARRLGDTPENIQAGIKSTIREFRTLLAEIPQAKVTIWYLSFAPVFSYYMFDDVVVLSLYKHRRGYVAMPAFVFERGGKLYDFIQQEHEAIMDDTGPLAKRIFPAADNRMPS